jgi:hypothetical protein
MNVRPVGVRNHEEALAMSCILADEGEFLAVGRERYGRVDIETNFR